MSPDQWVVGYSNGWKGESFPDERERVLVHLIIKRGQNLGDKNE